MMSYNDQDVPAMTMAVVGPARMAEYVARSTRKKGIPDFGYQTAAGIIPMLEQCPTANPHESTSSIFDNVHDDGTSHNRENNRNREWRL